MNWSLGSSELTVFHALCGAEGERQAHGKGLAAKLGLPQSAVSRCLKSLAEKKLATVSRNGKRNDAAVSDAPHALALKEFFAANPHVEPKILAHSGMRALSGLLFPGASVARVKKTGFLAEITARRALSKLRDAGVVGRKSPTNYFLLLPGLEKAVGEYVSFAATQAAKGAPGSVIAKGPYGLLRTSSENVPGLMQPTGLGALQEFGVKIIQTGFKDYYYNVFGQVKKPGLEEAITHALIRAASINSTRETSYALLALHKNRGKIGEETFLAAAGDLGAETTARQALDFAKAFAEGRKIPAPIAGQNSARAGEPGFPSLEEFGELVKQYG